MNGGSGINDGVFLVKFADGMQVCYTTPSGEISGLVYGDRRFNISGKCTCWII
jgi:hypothetical protein